MNQERLLDEIAYYSSFLHDYKNSQLQHSTLNKKIFVKRQMLNNPYKFVTNQQIPSNSVINTVQTTTSKKVLINPNFKQPQVHINPHFNATATNKMIHINPRILQTNILSGASNINYVDNSSREIALPLISPQKITSSVSSNIAINRKRRVSIRSKYKIVKSNVNNAIVKTPETRVRRNSIRSKYKIVKSFVSPKSVSNSNNIKTKYKIDNRGKTIKRKVTTNCLSDLSRNHIFKYKWKQNILNNKNNFNSSTRLTNISGILYKKTSTKLQKLSPSRKPKISISGKGEKRYSYVGNKQLLIRNMLPTPNKILLNNLRKFKISPNKMSIKNGLDDSVNRKSKKVEQRNKLRKNNQPCPVYRRYGKCRRKEAGRCVFLHNPNQIFLCKKFLQGACLDSDCLLSHKVSLEKMPTCKYYLEGCCTRNDCSYLHVKINPKADICKRFLEGFCAKGSQCNLRHQFLCPIFEREGKCPRRKCMYPHKKKGEKEMKKSEKESKNVKSEVVILNKLVVGETGLQIEMARYYAENKDKDVIKEDKVICDDNSTGSFYSRPQLGTLPSFIPFE